MCKTIKHKVRFNAPPETIYDLLADSGSKVGGTFSTDAGKVTGLNVDLVPGRRLVRAWRRSDFPEGIYSMAAITLAPTPRGGTELVLTHRGVPKHLLDQIEDYWRRVYWAPMKDKVKLGDVEQFDLPAR